MAIFALKEDTHRKISFRISEIGKPRVVLRLYVVKGVVSPSTLVMAGYKYPVFNLVVVAQRKTRNTRKRTEHAELPVSSAVIFPVCSAPFRPSRSFSAPLLSDRAAAFDICHWSLSGAPESTSDEDRSPRAAVTNDKYQ